MASVSGINGKNESEPPTTPAKHSIAVARYVPPEEFDAIAAKTRLMGFRKVVAGSSACVASRFAGRASGRRYTGPSPRLPAGTSATGSASLVATMGASPGGGNGFSPATPMASELRFAVLPVELEGICLGAVRCRTATRQLPYGNPVGVASAGPLANVAKHRL